QTNQAPRAFFVYTPSNPTTSDLITFDAASSVDSDGQIISYQWNFGDPSAGSGQTASTTSATTTHSYSTTGTYTANLVVFDNQNASSTAASTTISVSASGADHLVISEIMAGNGTNHSEEEFIELYNSTDQVINLNNWSLKRKTSYNSTSTPLNLVSNFAATSTIPAKGFFLTAHQDFLNYSTSTRPDFFYTNNSNQLAYDDDTVILYNNTDEIIDEVVYQNIPAGKSLERKAWQNNQCLSSQLDGEFLGNGCDTDNSSDLEIRDTPKPQNSLSLPEPRNPPTTPQNFTIQYSSSTMELIFNWDASQDYSSSTLAITYKITDVSNASSTISTIEAASTTAKTSISEFGRSYKFSIIAIDKEGYESEKSDAPVNIPPSLTVIAQQLDKSVFERGTG
ncbi:MAG: lamin tail domain-containing protein, partial [Patescibacteria group bacterium]